MFTPKTCLRFLLVSCGAGLLLGACASIMQGSSQEVSIASTPSGAKVFVDGTESGHTPYVANLKRKDKHVVRIELDGYTPFEMPLGRATSGWIWGNIVFGGLPGLAIDAITGGMYKLKPEQVQATLAQQGVSVNADRDQVVVAVVLRPDPAWERIASLQRSNEHGASVR